MAGLPASPAIRCERSVGFAGSQYRAVGAAVDREGWRPTSPCPRQLHRARPFALSPRSLRQSWRHCLGISRATQPERSLVRVERRRQWRTERTAHRDGAFRGVLEASVRLECRGAGPHGGAHSAILRWNLASNVDVELGFNPTNEIDSVWSWIFLGGTWGSKRFTARCVGPSPNRFGNGGLR